MITIQLDLNSIRARSPKGFSLVSMLAISMIATFAVSGLLAGILPVYRAIAGDHTYYRLRNFAEASIDYALAKINDPATASDFSNNTPNSVIQLEVTALELGLPGEMQASIIIKTEEPPPSSRIYNQALSGYGYKDDGNYSPISQDWSYFVSKAPSENYAWRTMTSTATYGNLTEKISVALMVDYSLPLSKGNSPFFQKYGALATQTVNFLGNARTFGLDSNGNSTDLGGDVGSFDKANFKGSGNVIGGTLEVRSIDANTLISANSDGNSTVNRYLIVSDDQVGFSEDTNPNVLGMFNQEYPNSGEQYIQTEVQQNQFKVPPAPSTPSTEPALDVVVQSPSALASGPVNVRSLNMTTNSIIPNGQTQVYVQDTGLDDPVVNLKGSINAGGNPSDFQIWYNGRGKIAIQPDLVNATIYAPNAEIEIKNPTSIGTFTGAVVGRSISLTNVEFKYDKTLSNPSSGLTYDPNELTPANLNTFKVASYKEVTTYKK